MKRDNVLFRLVANIRYFGIVGSDTVIAERSFVSGSLNIDVNKCIVIKNKKRILFASFNRNLFTLSTFKRLILFEWYLHSFAGSREMDVLVVVNDEMGNGKTGCE